MASTITGDTELIRKLEKIKDFSQLYPTLMEGAVHIKGTLARYPPATAANKPGGPGSHWYQRGYGSKWMRKDGTINGRQTSEDLGPSWWAQGEGGNKIIVGNDTSYGPYVQGAEDQAQALKNIGWKTTDDVVESESEKVLTLIKNKVDQILATG